MARLSIDDENALFYLHTPPSREGWPTVVFINALTGNTDAWEAAIAPRLRAGGFGTLSWNFRGQDWSTFVPGLALTEQLIVDDLARLVADLRPVRPVAAGLSIGGLYAAKAALAGVPFEGLVLMNTLREIGPRIAWVNDAMVRLVGHGGVSLFLDAFYPLLVGAEMAEKARPNFLSADYAPLPPEHGHMNLMTHASMTDWAVDWSALPCPVLSITGLEDRVFLDRAVVDRLFATVPDAEREDWEDAGHLLPQERPERLAAAISRFAARVAARA